MVDRKRHTVKLPDVDIDLADRFQLLEIVPHVVAVQIIDDRRRSHNSGIYLQKLPSDLNNLASLDYKTAELRQYFKFDLLNNSAYKIFDSKDELDDMSQREPDWSLFQNADIVAQLPHVHDHLHILEKLKPRSVEQLAAVLAIIRPGKRYLLNSDWATIDNEVWIRVEDQYSFKKSHAMAYAILIVAVLNKLTS